jgi:arylsulfatase
MADPRPNFLLIMTDQQRGDCLSIDGHPVLRTPVLDRVAYTGTRFKRAYSTCPVCIPARRSLMSGQHPQTHGLVGYQDDLEWDCPATLPGELKKAGYHTGIVGRNMHLAPERKRYGFDNMVIAGWRRGTCDYQEFLKPRTDDATGGTYGSGVMHNDWTARPWHMEDHLHQTFWTVTEAIKWLERRDPTVPYFLVVSFLAPHPPLNPPAFYMERYLRTGVDLPVIGGWAKAPENDGLGVSVESSEVDLRGELLNSCKAAYYGHINFIDDQINRLLNPVTRPAGGNTVVAFTSDHGEMLGDHYMFRKSQPYEGSARIPLLFSGPGIKAKQVDEHPVCLEDIMPTMLELAGVPIPASVDGKSLAPILRGETGVEIREYLHGEHVWRPHYLTDGKVKYIWNPKDANEQFFNLVDDPNEIIDLSQSEDWREEVAKWRSRLVKRLGDRPEGFVKDGKLVTGAKVSAVIPGFPVVKA